MGDRFKLNYSVPISEVMQECSRILMVENMLRKLRMRFSELQSHDPSFFEHSESADIYNKVERTIRELDSARIMLAEFDHMISEVEPMLIALREYYNQAPETEAEQESKQLELFE